MAAPKRRPTSLRILEGNPSKRPLPANEPKPNISFKVPNPPDHLSNAAKDEWKHIAKKLHVLGLLTDIDLTALSLYCQAYGRWVEAEETNQLIGQTITTTNGNIIQSPYISIANTAMRDCHKYLSEFGMTPSSRTNVSTTKKESKSKFSGLLGGANAA